MCNLMRVKEVVKCTCSATFHWGENKIAKSSYTDFDEGEMCSFVRPWCVVCDAAAWKLALILKIHCRHLMFSAVFCYQKPTVTVSLTAVCVQVFYPLKGSSNGNIDEVKEDITNEASWNCDGLTADGYKVTYCILSWNHHHQALLWSAAHKEKCKLLSNRKNIPKRTFNKNSQ